MKEAEKGNASRSPLGSDVPVFRAKTGTAAINWFHRNPALSNQHCLYCCDYVGLNAQVESDKEHLIARKMIPTGLLKSPRAFNLIFRACRRCNAEKAAVEGLVSAVTLLTSPGREDPAVDAEARRKALSTFDPRRRQAIEDIRNDIKLDVSGFMSVALTSRAQLSREDIALLAFRHVQGLFAMLTSADPTRSDQSRVLSAEHFGFFGVWPYLDWGNPQLLEISRRAYLLPRFAEITTADGFFRAALRRRVSGQPWFWALEWNQNFRVAGWVGPSEELPDLFQGLPNLAWYRIDATTRIRPETPLAEDAEDLLFDPVIT